ncbi:uncharacterized protein N7511_002497, partial [Penicillium nucicola]|uniref:uncharacterized protein n=1 Tax=Penicillium nucicola TaxID=1850975 RepID=UPI002545075D
RGPCPMMNTLANHGFLPHDGRNITRQTLMEGLHDALNFDFSLSSLMFDMGVVANPNPNASYFTLCVNFISDRLNNQDHLNRHNVLEHDASLSRTDAFFGNNHIFNKTIFNETRAYWTSEILTPAMLANSKIARQINSKAYNPNYKFTPMTEQFSLGEVAAPIIVFGNSTSGEVNRTLVEYFFENERLPIDLGWKISSKIITLDDILRATQMIRNATKLITSSPSQHRVRTEL